MSIIILKIQIFIYSNLTSSTKHFHHQLHCSTFHASMVTPYNLISFMECRHRLRSPLQHSLVCFAAQYGGLGGGSEAWRVCAHHCWHPCVLQPHWATEKTNRKVAPLILIFLVFDSFYKSSLSFFWLLTQTIIDCIYIYTLHHTENLENSPNWRSRERLKKLKISRSMTLSLLATTPTLLSRWTWLFESRTSDQTIIFFVELVQVLCEDVWGAWKRR